MQITRLAPSPTGALHLGNARTFLINWMIARQNGWKIILRIEDIDGPRIKPGADRQAVEDLKWLGLDWDDGPTYQTAHLPEYVAAAQRLLQAGNAYACICTRKDVELAASAPHAEDGAAIYPGTCRGRFESVDEARLLAGREPTIRFNVDSQTVTFTDLFCGPQKFEMKTLGDFVIEKSDRTSAYQLSVVVDDARMGITQVVRGDDLLDSTPRQILLYHALGLAEMVPQYTHLPLVVGEDGRRLAKRHGDTRLATCRAQGVSPRRVLGLMAKWCGIGEYDEIELRDLLAKFDINRLSKKAIIFTADENEWLRRSKSSPM